MTPSQVGERMRGMRWLLWISLLSAGTASAQSSALLEAVRLHKPGAMSQARDEWKACGAAEKPCADQASLALLLASLELSSGAPEAARELLTQVPAPELLEAHHAFLLGQAQFYSRNPAAAVEAFARAERSDSPLLAARARLRRGEALLSAGRVGEALTVFEREMKKRATPELLRQRAEARALSRNLKGAVADLKTLATEHPTHPASGDALERLKQLTKKKVSFTFDERLQRARAFLDEGQAREALEECRSAKAPNAARAAELALVRAQALFARGEEKAGLSALELAGKGSREIAGAAALIRARRSMKVDSAQAPELMREVDEKFQETSAGEEAGFYAGWLLMQRTRFEEALEGFKRFDERHPRSRRRDEIQWYRGLTLVRLSRHAEAAEAMQTLATQYPRSSLLPQARYWATRAKQQAGGKPEEIAEGFVGVLRDFPATFYARLAEVRLRELGREPAVPFENRPKMLEPEVPQPLRLALALTRAGQYPDAMAEVQAQMSRVRGTEQALAFAHSLRGLGEFGQAYAVAARHLWGRAFSERAGDALSLLYPLAWESTVRSAASSVKIDPNFVWAIMRRESAFKDWVASSADARGLMQIIPPTATRIAEELSEPAPSPDSLFSPALNVRYGAWYLSALMKRFGHPALAAAAYNAGPESVAKWAREKQGLPLDLFVEEIPFRETRGYVKQVMADLHLYHALYGDPAAAPKLQLTIPEPVSGVKF